MAEEPDKGSTSTEKSDSEALTSIAGPEGRTSDQSGTTVVERRGGWIPAMIGGLLAGCIGYGIAFFQFGPAPEEDTTLSDTVASNQTALEELQAAVSGLAEGPDFAPLQEALDANSSSVSAVTERVDAVQTELGDTLSGLTEQVTAIDARLTDIEQLPGADGSLSNTAVEAYEREIAALREETSAAVSELGDRMSATEQSVSELSGQVSEQLAALEEEATSLEAASEEAAAEAAARSALSRVQSAVESGAPFDGALSELTAASVVDTVPPILSESAAEGVPSLGELQSTFPEAARSALAVARDEGVAGDEGGASGFLRRQFNVRSVEPREGSEPDAVLSRAEAALGEGRLSDTLAEIETLPEVVRAAMSDWIGEATTRSEALSAVDELSQTLTSN
ncbi:COG4223 family protein [Pelagovum pacificum]|uniref:Mitochondrial inner membrane protein n=1 Tax=Pelagovum pacificum TaxID=2588711 RepID=A0A5C5GHP1_9RHOB|nr:hypothetical protein [Pelagovum pacificum]QQA42739.1 hypothetical protein I8N54_18520 [Pelagovum pacificum]TNY34110.1 hypothetical protein FHY64_12860 [Pelagovum pacificum]